MPTRNNWTRQQLLVAFNLYCQLPFGKMHSRNPEIMKIAALIGRTPSALAMKLTNIASLDPTITSTGRKGLDGASSADKALWQEMQQNWEDFALEAQDAADLLNCSADIESIDNDSFSADDVTDYTGTHRSAQVKIRIGQDFFRRSVLSAYNHRCCITGLSTPKLLVASHIIPWKSDAKNRLNPKNGLCLSALHDKAFDAGLLTITEDMRVKVSEKNLHKDDVFFRNALLLYSGSPISVPEKFFPNRDFLAYHREHIFDE